VVGLVHDRVGGRGEVVLAQRPADIDPPRGEEGVGHPTADDQMLHAGD